MSDKSRRRNGRRQNVTIKEVAELAGVSQMTVSRVLNNRNVVKVATRERVEKAIEELNYRPNLLARNLAGGQALFIGLIYFNPSSNYLSEIFVGALKQCREDGHHLVIEKYAADSDDMEGALDHICGAGLDAVIIAPPLSEDKPFVDALRKRGVLSVLIAPRDPHISQLSVSIDDEAAAAKAVEYLIVHGYKQMGFIRGPDEHASSRRRFRGFESAVKAHGIEVAPDWIQQGDYTYRSGMQAAERILKAKTRPDVIFASNDDMAAGAIAAAHRLGLRVPEDISFFGFDDTTLASAIWPQLSTVRQPIQEMAAASVEQLTRHFSEDDDEQHEDHVVFETTIVERESVADRS